MDGDATNTAGEPVPTDSQGKPCDWCGTLIPIVGRRRIRTRRFCRNLCRTRWHAKRRDDALARLRSAVTDIAAAIEILR